MSGPRSKAHYKAINDALEADPRVDDWYCYSPDPAHGRRWVVWGAGLPNRGGTYTTKEVEFLISTGAPLASYLDEAGDDASTPIIGDGQHADEGDAAA